MAWKRCDDMDGSTEDVLPVALGYDGELYVLHLGPASREALDRDLAPWLTDMIPHRPLPTITDAEPEARSIRPAPVRQRVRSTNTTRPDIPEIRAWASERGIEIRPFGRIATKILEQYDAEQATARKMQPVR